MKFRVGIVLRLALALLVASSVFVPVAAQAATCAMPACSTGCCEMQPGAAPAEAMSMGSCCTQPGATMSQSSCPGSDERSDFKAVSAIPDVVAPAVALGAASVFSPDLHQGRSYSFISANARGPGDLLAGTRLRV